MKALRAKRLKKLLLYYKIHYNFEPPYRVIVDGSFMLFAIEKKLYFKDQLPKILQAKALPLVTKCIATELRRMGDDAAGAALMAKRMEHVHCAHEDHPVSAEECIKSVIAANPKQYFVATQNGDLQRTLEHMAGVPILFFFNNVLTIVKPSHFDRVASQFMDRKKGEAAPEERQLVRETLKQMKQVDLEKQRAYEYLFRQVKTQKAKGPNPLSVLKSKKIKTTKKDGEKKKKRKRNRTRSGEKKALPTPADQAPTEEEEEGSIAAAAGPSAAETSVTPATSSSAASETEKKPKKRRRNRKRKRAGVKRRKLLSGEAGSVSDSDSDSDSDSSDDSSAGEPDSDQPSGSDDDSE